MSAAAAPIAMTQFAEAIQDLPVGNLHLKAAEIRNSILHLQLSIEELIKYADNGDTDCAEAIQENQQTIVSMEQRISLLKDEVKRRGLVWPSEAGSEALLVGKIGSNGTGDGGQRATSSASVTPGHETSSTLNLQNTQDNSDEGLHL